MLQDGIQFIRHHSKTRSSIFTESITFRGLKKMRYLLDLRGYMSESVFFATAPDFSVSLNAERLRGGYCVGGLFTWGDGSIPIMPIDMMPNCCGILFAEIRGAFHPQELLRRINSFVSVPHMLDGLPLVWDMNRKNHFLNIYSNKDGKNYVAMHGSLPEVKSDNPLGMGVYYTNSKKMKEILNICQTPFGNIYYLDDKNAIEFTNLMKLYDDLSKKKREYIVNILFDECIIISNENHLSFIDMNTVVLGCNSPEDPTTPSLITVGPGKPAYVCMPNHPILINGCQRYIIPHGTGNKLEYFDEVYYDIPGDIIVATTKNVQLYTRNINMMVNGYNSETVITDDAWSMLYNINYVIYPIYEYKL